MRAKLVHLTDRQFEYLKKSADAIGISVSELIRRILDENIETGRPVPKNPSASSIPMRMEPDS